MKNILLDILNYGGGVISIFAAMSLAPFLAVLIYKLFGKYGARFKVSQKTIDKLKEIENQPKLKERMSKYVGLELLIIIGLWVPIGILWTCMPALSLLAPEIPSVISLLSIIIFIIAVISSLGLAGLISNFITLKIIKLSSPEVDIEAYKLYSSSYMGEGARVKKLQEEFLTRRIDTAQISNRVAVLCASIYIPLLIIIRILTWLYVE